LDVRFSTAEELAEDALEAGADFFEGFEEEASALFIDGAQGVG